MFETCRRCGFVGPVQNRRLHTQPILAFYSQGGRHRYDVDVWLCDVCASEVRNHSDSSLHSGETTDQAQSKKRNEHV